MDVLLVFLSKTYNREKLDNLLANYDERGYHIYVFHNCEKEVQLLQDLPQSIAYIKSQESENPGRIVVLSNIREFICTWYRLYNSTVDDYIYYIDEYISFNVLQGGEQFPYFDFYHEIANLNDMVSEAVQGKIYVNLDLDTLNLVGQFLLTESRFVYFQPLASFIYETKADKKLIVSKKYIYNQLELTFERILDVPEKLIAVNSKSVLGLTFSYHPELMQEHHYFFFFLLVIVYKSSPVSKEELQSVLFNIVETTDFTNTLLTKSTYDGFYRFCQKTSTSFFDKIYMGSLLAKYIKFEMVSTLIQVLLKDNKHIPYHYPLLVNSLFYLTQYGHGLYPGIYKDREKVLDRIVYYYRKKIKYSRIRKKRPKHIAIIVTQLLSILHSPTLLTLNYVKCFKEQYPEYHFKIFVDELFIYPANEVAFPYVISSIPSERCKDIHADFLQGTDTEFYYPDLTKDRTGRIQDILNAVDEFSPELIFGISSDFCICRPFLYENYPFVDLCVGTLSNSVKADYYITGHDEVQVRQECEKYNYNLEAVKNNRYLYRSAGVNFPEPVKTITRALYHIDTEDFVMVTVGNRLDGEVTDEFVNLICSFLRSKPNAKWLIVGKAELSSLKNGYLELFDKQIICIEFESDLPALYRICDIYVNPFRIHGGYSAGMAMAQSLPVITRGGVSDVAAAVGYENCMSNNADYLGEIEHIYDDKEYKFMKGNLMKKRITEKFSLKNAIDDMILVFDKTIISFGDRRKK